jgi:hypothetical protein
MFTIEERDRAREYIIAKARSDPRVVAAAEMGSLVAGTGDRWSDLDLTFGVIEKIPIGDVIEDWTRDLAGELGATHLFDLPLLSTIYRVFLLPGNLQVDLSFTPEQDFGPLGPKWSTIFGKTVTREGPPPPSRSELFGLAVHAALRARVCIERSKPWAAEYWIRELRDHTMSLVCLLMGLPAKYARGFDDLPPELSSGFETALVTALDRYSLLRALRGGIDLLLRHAEDEQLSPVRDQLLELKSDSLD